MSLAAGVLTAALALPPQGLVAAYDFARVNFVNWSEDLTQSAWVKTGVNVQAMTGLHPEGLPMYSVVETAVNADHRVDQSFSSVPSGLWFAEMDMKRHGRDVVSFGFGTGSAWAAGLPAFSINFATGQVSNLFPNAQDSGVSARHIGNGVYRVKFTARQAAAPSGTPTIRCWTGASVTTTGDGASGVLLTRIKVGFGTDSEYERTTDAQLLLDRSVRLWPAPPRRTNLLTWTEEPNMPAWTNGSSTPTVTLNTGTTPRGFPAWTISGGYKAISVFNRAGAALTSSCVMKGSAGSATTFFVFPKGTGQSITVDANGTVTANSLVDGTYTVTPLGGGWFEVALTYTPDADRTISTLYVHSASGSVQIGEARVNLGPTALPYERQTDGVTYDFSLKSRNLLPNSDLAGAAGVAPVGWAASNATSISYGADGSVTFTATARFGSVFVHSSLVPVAGRPFTMSVDLTSGAGRLVPYLYDHNGTYLTVLGSTPVNGRAVLQVNRTDVYRVEFRIEDDRASGWTPITFRRPMLELGLTDGGYQPSARHSTLGSATGPDSNDPIWGPAGLTFDGVDDSTMAGAFVVPDGDFTFIEVFTPLVDSGATDGKSLTRSISGAGQWRTTNYLGGVSLGGPSVMGWKVGVYHVTGGFSNSGFTYFNVGQVLAGQARVGVMRVRGLIARADLLASATMPAIGQTQTLPAAPVGGAFGTFGNSANAVLHGYYLWNRSLTDAEITQAYRVIRNQLSRRGVTI